MRILSEDNKKILKISKQEWIDIGQNVGWLEKKSDINESVIPEVKNMQQPISKEVKLRCKVCNYIGPKSEFVDESGFQKEGGCPECGSNFVAVEPNK